VKGTSPTPERKPLRTRFTDDRGQAAILLDGGGQVDFLEYLEFAGPSVVRGGHFHRRYTEHLFVAEGRLEAELLDCTGPRPAGLRRMELESGVVLRIPPGWGHRFTALEPSRAVAWGFGDSPMEDREQVAEEDWEA
jgi:mannose-6-phosphate isomerase-like protein (cupin superfamily)